MNCLADYHNVSFGVENSNICSIEVFNAETIEYIAVLILIKI